MLGSDFEPAKLARFNAECDYMRRRWGGPLANDPLYNPNLTLTAPDMALAFPPRVVKPWRLQQPLARMSGHATSAAPTGADRPADAAEPVLAAGAVGER